MAEDNSGSGSPRPPTAGGSSSDEDNKTCLIVSRALESAGWTLDEFCKTDDAHRLVWTHISSGAQRMLERLVDAARAGAPVVLRGPGDVAQAAAPGSPAPALPASEWDDSEPGPAPAPSTPLPAAAINTNDETVLPPPPPSTPPSPDETLPPAWLAAPAAASLPAALYPTSPTPANADDETVLDPLPPSPDATVLHLEPYENCGLYSPPRASQLAPVSTDSEDDGIFDTLIRVAVMRLTQGTGRFGVTFGFVITCCQDGHGFSILLSEFIAQYAGYTAAFLTLAAICAANACLFGAGVRIPPAAAEVAK